jgi:hypothetical protein
MISKGNLYLFFYESHKDADITILKYFLQVPTSILPKVVVVYITWSNTDMKRIDIFKFTEHEVDELVLGHFIFI